MEIISLTSTVTEVGEHAFGMCTNLREVIFNERLQAIDAHAFDRCESLECAKFPAVSKRINNLIEASQTDIEDKITIYQHFEWRGGDELLACPEAINDENWEITTRRNLDRLLAWISYYELKEATPSIELAMWKKRIEETGAVTAEERNSCRVEVPGPAKDAIIQYYG